jgi:hypothetical protein
VSQQATPFLFPTSVLGFPPRDPNMSQDKLYGFYFSLILFNATLQYQEEEAQDSGWIMTFVKNHLQK